MNQKPRKLKKSRTCQHGTRKIKGHRSTKYKDLQRFKTQKTQTQTQPLGGVWFVILNNYFQFLNNISRISTHFFTHTYFQKYFQTTIFSF